MIYDSFRPGEPWLDTGGHRIHAHGGSILFQDGIYYWYGENKEQTTGSDKVWHWGVRCYASSDLYNWEDLGLIIAPDTDDPGSPLHPSRLVDRPHILYNRDSGTYVCWIKIMGEGLRQTATVLTADSLMGPWKIVRTDLRPCGMNAGDFDLVIDPDDGKAYYYFERPHSELICADLTPDYTDVTGYYSTHYAGRRPPETREAPAYFVRGGRHYLITSGTSGYFPNPSEFASAPAYHGPWTVIGDAHPDDASRTSYRSQVSSVFKHPGKRDLYIALADRWLPRVGPERSNQQELFRRLFSGEPEEQVRADAPPEMDDVDTSIADYVWLPVTFDGGVPSIVWRQEWRIEDYD